MDLPDITRGNLLECVLAAGAILGQAAESHGMRQLSYLADAQAMADAVAPLDPVAATVIREGANRVLHPPEDDIIESDRRPDVKLPPPADCDHILEDGSNTCVQCGAEVTEGFTVVEYGGAVIDVVDPTGGHPC